MDKFNLLDCTLRDGGYINKWNFSDAEISAIIKRMIDSNIDFIEVGYLNAEGKERDSTQFKAIKNISKYIPKERKNSTILAMADVQQFYPENLVSNDGDSIDGIRVVFYKYQIDEAIRLAKAVKDCGYQLFLQPMVTIDYTLDEYADLIKELAKLKPEGVSIVDSFGYMLKSDFRQYFKVLDNLLDSNVMIGFHSHNNLDLAFITAQDILEYNTHRRLIIDSSLYGMGRGAGNLNTELIANYYNMTLGYKYKTDEILSMIGEYILPIRKERIWGYSPYLFITGVEHCHPNFACYLLEEYSVTVSEFNEFIRTIPQDMKTKCKKPYVIEMWEKYKRGKNEF